MMLKHTLLLPESDPQLARQLLDQAINDLHVVLMLVIGKEYQQIVEWGDQLCDKTQMGDSNVRRVIWVRDPAVAPIKERLIPLLGDGSPVVVVLNFYDKLACRLPDASETVADIDPIQLEIAFLKGQGR